jgi:hypothetical protein
MLVIEKNSGEVVYFGEFVFSPWLTSLTKDWVDTRLNPENSQILNEAQPEPWLGERAWRQTEKGFALTEWGQTLMAERDVAQGTKVRAERNAKLSASDWTQVADAPVDKAAWAAYRQALRDITAQEGFPWTIDWPVQP